MFGLSPEELKGMLQRAERYVNLGVRVSDALLRFYGYEKTARFVNLMYTVTSNGATGFITGGVPGAFFGVAKGLIQDFMWGWLWDFLLDMLTVDKLY